MPKHVVMFEEADICGAHLSDWTVVLPEGVKPAVRLNADGGRLSLDLVPQGAVILFR